MRGVEWGGVMSGVGRCDEGSGWGGVMSGVGRWMRGVE